MRNKSGQFISGHKKVGGFKKGSRHSQESKNKVSQSLIGKTGEKSRRWKGNKAGYVAKHIWIAKQFGKASRCENLKCVFTRPKRFEWANISKKHRRKREDYIQLCCSCHRKYDNGMEVMRGKL